MRLISKHEVAGYKNPRQGKFLDHAGTLVSLNYTLLVSVVLSRQYPSSISSFGKKNYRITKFTLVKYLQQLRPLSM